MKTLLFLVACLTPAFAAEDGLTTVRYAAGYIPNVQFAPFYIAMSRGYYKEVGIELEMDYTIGPEVLKMVALNKVQVGSVDPDAFLHAVVRKMPLTHVATLYQNYPISLIAREPITSASLKGKRIGVTGTYGASYLGLKAILEENGLGLSDVRVASIGYTQVASLENGRVDAVVGYANNEPLRLAGLGVKTHTLGLSAGSSIPGVGLMAEQKWFAENKDLVNGFLKATFRGMRDVLDDPEGCFRLIVDQYLPELKGATGASELEVLKATLPYWQSARVLTHGFGQCEPDSWDNLARLLGDDQTSNPYKSWRDWVDMSFTYK